mmetsp:Transcript_5389/g.8515  ORF Transcript_5389/g.8515 Transcript_5389/m.8515 type:complete len:330 (-) Transcript_5389:566-1555(-)
MARVSVPRNSQPDMTSSSASDTWAGAAVRVTNVISSLRISVSSTGSAISGDAMIAVASTAPVNLFIGVPPKTIGSRNRDVFCGLVNGPVIVVPGELELARFGHHRYEFEVGVGRNRGLQRHINDVLAVEIAGKAVDDRAGDGVAIVILALPGFHLVADQRLDGDRIASGGGLGHFNAGFYTFCHVIFSCLAAAAADCDFDGRGRLNEGSVVQLGDRDHVLRACQTDACGCSAGCGQRPEFEGGDGGRWIAHGQHHDFCGGLRRHFDWHCVAVLGNLGRGQGDVACGHVCPAGKGGDGVLGHRRCAQRQPCHEYSTRPHQNCVTSCQFHR